MKVWAFKKHQNGLDASFQLEQFHPPHGVPSDGQKPATGVTAPIRGVIEERYIFIALLDPMRLLHRSKVKAQDTPS